MGFSDDLIEDLGLRLRPLTNADSAAIAEACADPSTLRWLPLPRPYTQADAEFFIQQIAVNALASGDGIERAIEVDGLFAGVIGLKATNWAIGKTEAGYWLSPKFRGQAIMPRALTAITNWAFATQSIRRMEVHVATENYPSQAVARKAGFLQEGVLRQAGQVHGGVVDLMIFSRLASDPIS